jgi:uncharacterized membrane protein YbhN (UPF0104 family)
MKAMARMLDVRRFLRLGVSAVLLALLAWRSDWGQIGHVFAHLRIEYWLAAAGLYLFTQAASALRWQLFARPLEFRRPFGDYLRFYFIGMFFNLFLPTSVGGDVVRAFYLDGKSGHRLTAFLSVMADRLSGLGVLVGLACAATFFCPAALPVWVPLSVWISAGCGLLALLVSPLLFRMTNRFDRIRRLASGIQLYLGKPQLLLWTTLLSLFVQGSNVVLVWLVGQAIDAPVPASYYWIVVPMVTLLTLLPVSLNGMGVREGGMALFLAPLGIREATALSLSFLWFSIYTAISLCGAVVYLAGSLPRPEESKEDEHIDRDSDQGRTGQFAAAA